MKGFRNFAKGIGGAMRGSGDGDVDSAVEVLLQRVADGVLAEDRREALADLRDLLSNNAQDRQDVEMLRGAVECLTIAIGHPARQSEASHKGPQPAAINAELFSKGNGNIALLLGLLEDEPAGVSDFYVRYHTVQLLTSLAAVSSYRMQEAILAAPMGVVHLMDMMTDMEALRNEVLLLLIGLTHANPSIQQIAAFEGAFERLLNIIRDEGAADGGIVVQDCFEMMNNLLRGNPKNQMLFREMGYLSSLPGLLRTQANIQKPLARQKVGNLLAALDSLYLLLAPVLASLTSQANETKAAQPDKAGTQICLLKAGCLDALLQLIGASSVAVRSQALRCIWQLVEGNHACQQHLLEASAPSFQGTATSALQVVLRIVLHGRDIRERIGALKVLQAFCVANSEGQQALITTVTLPSTKPQQTTGHESSFGTELMHSLLDTAPGGLQASGRAARVLSYLLADNDQCKETLLAYLPHTSNEVETGVATTGPLTQFLQVISAACNGGNEAHMQTAILFMLLMITWLAGAPAAVKRSLYTALLLPVLVSCISSREEMADPLVAGLAAILLGACLTGLPQDHQDAEVLDAIKSQIGMSDYLAAIQGLKDSAEFIAATRGSQAPRTATLMPASLTDGKDEAEGHGLEQAESPGHLACENPFDPPSVQLVLAVERETRQRLLGRQAGQSSDTTLSLQTADVNSAKLQQAESLIQQLQRELSQLRACNTAGASSSGQHQSPQSSQQEDGPSVAQAADAQEACKAAEAQVSRLQSMVQLLTDEKRELQSGMAAARQAEQDAVASVQRLETEMSDLAGAYNNLEVHSYQLEAHIKRLQIQVDHTSSAAGSSAKDMHQAASPDEDAEDADAEESAMSDLLTCLGIEEQKVQIFQAKLEELGVDVQPLLDAIEDT